MSWSFAANNKIIISSLQGRNKGQMSGMVAMVALGFMLLAISLITSTDWQLIDSRSFPQNQTDEIIATVQNSIPSLSKMLLTEYVLAFEMVGVLLLAAVLGALALVREKK